MKIIVNHRVDHRNNLPVESYSRSYVYYFRELGHQVIETGEGTNNLPGNFTPEVNFLASDLVLDIDSGRNPQGEQCFLPGKPHGILSAVVFIDSHGNPSLHKRLASNYDHVFFAVWAQRDLFAKHPSAHFCPNATDLRWFPRYDVDDLKHELEDSRALSDFGFFGSKGGLNRADPMKVICESKGWSYDIRQINGPYRHKWPHTALAMANCRFLFNHGQKHDINLRIFESMAVGRPLISDSDPVSGIDKLFKGGGHYIPYQSYSYHGLDEAMEWAMSHAASSKAIADEAYTEVATNHTIKNRVQQILEVIGG